MNLECKPRRVAVLLWWGVFLLGALIFVGNTVRGESWQGYWATPQTIVPGAGTHTITYQLYYDTDYEDPNNTRWKFEIAWGALPLNTYTNFTLYHTLAASDYSGGPAPNPNTYTGFGRNLDSNSGAGAATAGPFVTATDTPSTVHQIYLRLWGNGAGWVNFTHIPLFAINTGSTQSVSKRSLPWSFTNSRSYAVRLEVVNTSNTVIQSVDIPALQTVSKATLATVLTWLNSAGVVGVRVRIPANYVNGKWESASLDLGDTLVVGSPSGYEGYQYDTPVETPPLEPMLLLPFPAGAPANDILPPDSQPVWTAGGDETPLENGVYKEGVEKQLAELQEIKELVSGDGMIEEPGSAGFPAAAAEGDQFSGKTSAGELMTKLGNLLPTAPDHIFPNTVTKSPKYALTFPMNAVSRGAIADIEFDLDVTPFDTGVQFCRGVALAVLSVLTYLIVVETVRRIFV